MSIWKVLTMSCDEASHIISDQLDRELTRLERYALKAHMISCARCKRFRGQVRLISQAAKRTPGMPPKVEKRIREALQAQSEEQAD